MDKVNQKMRKFNLRGVLIGLRATALGNSPHKLDSTGIEETLRSEHFQVAKTFRHGFPYQPTVLAYDPVQNILAIGTKTGALRIFGRPGVELNVQHESCYAVLQLIFLVNEGALLSVCADDQIHLWTLKQRRPEIVHSLKFQREKISYCHLPFQSKWLYVGTERGNVHVVSLESFTLSGYIINWNKAIELGRSTHPGSIVHLSDNPVDVNRLLIGFESGCIVLWDLKNKNAEFRYTCVESLCSICWHHEGKQFICSHCDGSVTIWNFKVPQQPQSYMMPHAKLGKDGKPETCRAITKIDYRTVRNSEPYVIFSGGTASDPRLTTVPSLTVMKGNNMTVLEMEHEVVDFVTLSSTPWNSDFQDPHSIAVLLQNDLVVVDMTSQGYPCYENPYPMDIHDSPVTSCLYFADCPPDLIPAYYSVGCKSKPKSGYSEKEWPVHGGEWGTANCNYPEIIVTGHADGAIKFWDASSVSQHMLYKIKTSKLFDESQRCADDDDDCPFAVHRMYLCTDSRLLCVAGNAHVILLSFSKLDASIDCPVLEVSIMYEISDYAESPDVEYPSAPPKHSFTSQQYNAASSYASLNYNGKESQTTLRTKAGQRKWSPGYQPSLCCLLTWVDGEPPPPVTSLSVNSRFGLLAFGNDCGLAIIDIVQKTCLLSMGTPDLYGSMDPYSRAPRSPKSKQQTSKVFFDTGLTTGPQVEDCKSPSVEQAQDKTDSSFSQSHSSSMTSLDNINKEAIQCLVFTDAYTRKAEQCTCPCLWVGTSLGTVLVISLTLSTDVEIRRREPVIVSPSGTIFRLKGSITAISFLDCNGILIPTVAEPWTDVTCKDDKKASLPSRQSSSTNLKSGMSPTSSVDVNSSSSPAAADRQFAIICSEKQARVISLPSQNCTYKVKITETSVVIKADIISFRDSVCLAVFVANGHVMAFSLPSLRLLLDNDYLPFPDVRVARTFCFSSNGHALHLCSPSEIQKLTISAEECENLKEMVGELFQQCTMPEAPKQNFFKNLFIGAISTTVDREELFGESSGKASRSVATYTPGPAGMTYAQDSATSAVSDIARAKMVALERGEKLSELEEKTERMKLEAEAYSSTSHQLKVKYRDKKWYQF